MEPQIKSSRKFMQQKKQQKCHRNKNMRYTAETFVFRKSSSFFHFFFFFFSSFSCSVFLRLFLQHFTLFILFLAFLSFSFCFFVLNILDVPEYFFFPLRNPSSFETISQTFIGQMVFLGQRSIVELQVDVIQMLMIFSKHECLGSKN